MLSEGTIAKSIGKIGKMPSIFINKFLITWLFFISSNCSYIADGISTEIEILLRPTPILFWSGIL